MQYELPTVSAAETILTAANEGDGRAVAGLAVPWDRADMLKERLANEGFVTTLCLAPGVKSAHLVPWPGVESEAAAAALAAIIATESARHMK